MDSLTSALPEPVRLAARAQLAGADPERASVVGEGWNATAWRLPGRHHDWLLRVPRLREAVAEMERQACLGPRLLALGLRVPAGWRLLHDAGGRTIACAYRFVDGAPAPRGGRLALAGLARQLGALLTRLHALDPRVGVACGARVLDPLPGRYVPLVRAHAARLGPRTRSWLAEAVARLDGASARAPPPVLLHGDLQPAHFLCDQAGAIVAVLDFYGPLVSDPAIDFGRLVQHWGEAFALAALRFYDRPVDPAFRERMVLYARLEPLRTFAVGVALGEERWLRWGRRRLAAHAGRSSPD